MREDVAFGDIVHEGSMWVPADRIDTTVTAEEIVEAEDPTTGPQGAPLGGGKGPLKLPVSHIGGIRVPKGGSSCNNCRFVSADGTQCSNLYFVEWNGGNPILPYPADEYCSDWYEPNPTLMDKK